jgi:hypothetical protein
MRNPLFDLSREKDQSIIQSIRDRLTVAGLSIICDPRAFQFERQFFLETNMNINAEAAERRMEALGVCMSESS